MIETLGPNIKMETAPKHGAGGRPEVVYLLFVTHTPAFRPRPWSNIMYITYILNVATVSDGLVSWDDS